MRPKLLEEFCQKPSKAFVFSRYLPLNPVPTGIGQTERGSTGLLRPGLSALSRNSPYTLSAGIPIFDQE
jgi:hypothetical protein